MKKTILTLAVAVCTTMVAHAQLLYKISGNGLAEPSYIIGTHHLASVGFIDKIAGVKDALTATQQVYGELDMSLMQNADSLSAMQQAMQLPEGQSLKTVLTAEQYQKLNTFVTKMMGVGLDHPMVGAQLNGLKPAALTTQMTLLLFMQKHMSEFDPTTSFDAYFQAQAKKNNEPVGGLETMKMQQDLLYNSQPIARQVELLMCLLDNSDYALAQMEDLTKAFYAQDTAAIEKAMDEKLNNSCDASEEENAALIYDRNTDWSKRMPTIMAEKPTFFAVGCGHLVGDKGVLQLLRAAGYTIEGVK